METITIPSPSAFLRSPEPYAAATETKPKTVLKRQSKIPRAQQNTAKRPDSVAKPKQSKSRNGCVTCKAKRLKCDEAKPTCQQCHKRNVSCGGYKKDFKWRSFEEATFTSKPAPQRPRKAPAKSAKPGPHSPAISETSTTSVSVPVSSAQPAYQNVFSTQATTSSIDPQLSHSTFSDNDQPFALGQGPFPPNGDPFASNSQQYQDPMHPLSTPNTVDTLYDDGNNLQSAITTASSFSSSQSPRLIDLLLPGTDLNAPLGDQIDFQSQQSDVPYQPSGYALPQTKTMDAEEDVEEIIRQPDPAAEAWVMRLPSPSPSSSSSSSDNSYLDPFSSIYSQPKLHAGSPEMLMLRFDRQTCGILSVKDGPTENPWRTLVWPLARESPALYHAISSMTAFHATKLKPEMKVEGMEHMRRSIRHLAGGLENMRTDTALATTLALAFSESWDVHVSTGIEHLRGAKILVNQALTRHRQSSLVGDDLMRLRFLCNTWVYMDVIARLTSVDDDDSNDFDSALWLPPIPDLTTEIDPLMGCASTLFPLVGRVANLVRKVRKTSSNSINIISQANDLKTAIEDWEPSPFFEPPEDPSSEIKHSLQTAEAYRWATLLYLHQAVPEIPSRTAAEMAKKVLICLATVPLSSRAIIIQIYPLLAAGCEAIGQEDRSWVEERWTSMSQRMLIGNIDRCLEVIKEVWDRRDSYEAEKYRQQRRRFNQRRPSSYSSPVQGTKRAFSGEEPDSIPVFDWPGSYDGSKRRAAQDEAGMPIPLSMGRPRKQAVDIIENLEFQMTVRGPLHWVGVMKDWNWEVLLG